MSDTTLTDKQQKIYNYIRKHIEGKCYPPAIRDICDAFAISSPNGVKVIVMGEHAMTVKTIYKKKDQIRLQPMNSAMEAILVDPKRQDVRILGVLAGVIRKC